MRHQAIRNLYPNVWKILSDDQGDHAFDKEEKAVIYDNDLVNKEVERLNTEWINNEYKLKRSREYPSVRDFADAMFWASKGDETKLQEYYAACQAVKDKYPKTE